MKGFDADTFLSLTHSTLHNYILPGLESRMIGATSRVFVNTRESIGAITPHSHRFGFQCLVLQGYVENTLFTEDAGGDLYQTTLMEYMGTPGKYDSTPGGLHYFLPSTVTHVVGEWYGMQADEIHTIRFSRDAIVLFVEGLPSTAHSVVLEPHVNGATIRTMHTEAWMFTK